MGIGGGMDFPKFRTGRVTWAIGGVEERSNGKHSAPQRGSPMARR
jgi:hypothetical protein